MAATNDTELTIQLSKAFSDILEDVMANMLDALQEAIIVDVYEAGYPEQYTRTWDFLNSWETTKPQIMNNIVSSELWQNVSTMEVDPDNFIHGSRYFTEEDMRSAMANIIFEGLSGDMFGQGYWTAARNAWGSFLETVEQKFDTWVHEAGLKNGLVLSQGSLRWAVS